MGDTFRVHLVGPGHSGRYVRYRVLSSTEVDQVEKLASDEMEKDSNTFDLNTAVARNGLERMVVAVTEPAKNGTVPAFTPCTPGELSTQWAKLFTARDTAVLKRLYQREHVVTEAEVDAIMEGKVQETDS